MRNDMRPKDGVLFYHSSCPEPGIAGLAEVVGAPYPDETQFDPDSHYFDPKSRREAPRWYLVDVKLVEKTRLLSLQEMRAAPELATMRILRRGNRLSITPVTDEEWRAVLHRLQRRTGKREQRAAARPHDARPRVATDRRAAAARRLRRVPGRAARRRRRHADGAVHDLRADQQGHAGALRRQDGDRDLARDDLLHVAVVGADAPPARRGALGRGDAAGARHHRRLADRRAAREGTADADPGAGCSRRSSASRRPRC